MNQPPNNAAVDSTICPGCFAEPPAGPVCTECGYDQRTERPANALPAGVMLDGKYLIGRVLGKPGGFGITYLALDRHLRTTVAIKEYLPRDWATRGADGTTIVPQDRQEAEAYRYGLNQFAGEARLLALLDHPNIVRVRHFFEANASAYLVMDYYLGLTLAEHLDGQPLGRLPERQALDLMLPVLDGLRAVHEQGFMHRDIKPPNIYLARTGRGGVRPILLDFGAARQAVGTRSRSLSVVVSDGYAPLEQYGRKGRQGPWTDIYSAAAVLYRALTGHTPPTAPDRLEEDDLVAPTEFGISAPVSVAVMAALATTSTARPQTIRAFQRRLSEPGPTAPRSQAPTTAASPSSDKMPDTDPDRARQLPRLHLYPNAPSVPTDPSPRARTTAARPSSDNTPDTALDRARQLPRLHLDPNAPSAQTDPSPRAETTAAPPSSSKTPDTAPDRARQLPRLHLDPNAPSAQTDPSPRAGATLKRALPAPNVRQPRRAPIRTHRLRNLALSGFSALTVLAGGFFTLSPQESGRPVSDGTETDMQRDTEAFDEARAIDTIDAYKRYVDECPASGCAHLAEALLNIGFQYAEGDEGVRDQTVALRWFQRAANNGSMQARYLVGRMYATGTGTAANPRLARRWLTEPAEAGHAKAQVQLGLLLAPNDEQAAAKWYRKAAEDGDAEGQFRLGSAYAWGRGVPLAERRALYWLNRAVEQGHHGAQNAAGAMVADGRGTARDDARAVELLDQAAEAGYPSAQARLAHLHLDGRGTDKDPGMALHWLLKAANQGLASAQSDLGRLYSTGGEIQADPARAVHWLRMAAKQGQPRAQLMLGEHYARGEGIPRDERQAAHWLLLAANGGEVSAQYQLGIRYARGQGVPENQEVAWEWLLSAAEGGHNGAQKLIQQVQAAQAQQPAERAQASAARAAARATRRDDTGFGPNSTAEAERRARQARDYVRRKVNQGTMPPEFWPE